MISESVAAVGSVSQILTHIGVFHAMAGMAAAMPGLFKFPSAGKEIEASR